MPRLPVLNPGNTTRVMTDVFRGYNHNQKIVDGEMYDTQNLTTDYYPLLASRKPRGVKAELTKPGGLIEKDYLYYIENGTLYYLNSLGVATATNLTGISEGEKQLVSMGSYIYIHPDKMYYNTADATDYGSVDATWASSSSGSVYFWPTSRGGGLYMLSGDPVGPTPPANPQDGQVWIDTASKQYKRYDSGKGGWIAEEKENTCALVVFAGNTTISTQFHDGDGTHISGFEPTDLNGDQTIIKVGHFEGSSDAGIPAGDYIILNQFCEPDSQNYTTNEIIFGRVAPDMDFVIECQNRLWGCKYGLVNGANVNEIYCTALGDFKNWNTYEGISTDSWAASVGSDGPWTGAVNFLGHPCFFKQNRVHTVTVSSTGAHRIDETVCRGVDLGSSKSLQVVGETLYYKSHNDVCAWQGGFPTSISAPLGEAQYTNAVGGAYGNKYYLSMKNKSNTWDLFVYDAAKNLWLREDNLHATCFAKCGNELWCIDSSKNLIALYGTAGTAESSVPWSMETGMLYYEYPDKKYLSRYDIRLSMSEGASATLYMEYDSSGEWINSGSISCSRTTTVVVPVRPRRCDHLRMKLAGTGAVKIFSVARTLEVGSDV